MAALTVQKPSLAGAALTLAAAAAGGDTFPNSGKEVFVIANGHATLPRTVTFDAPGTCDFGLAANAAHDVAVAVTALTQRQFGPFPVARFGATVSVTYSDSAADLTVAVQSKD